MRTRFLLAALVAAGVTAGTAWGQVGPPPQPDNVPKDAKPGTTPATQPDNTPRTAPPGSSPATQPDNAKPGTTPPPPKPPVVVAPGTSGTATGGTTTTGGAVRGSTTGGATVVTPVAVPPELAKIEAEAAVEIPAPRVPAGRAPEAKAVAEAAVKVRRATWVVEKLLPPPPEGTTTLSFTGLKVGAHGWLDTTGDVVSTAEGVMVVRPAGVNAEGPLVGLPVTDTSTTVKSVNLRGEYAVDRAVTVDGRDVLVLKEVAAAKALDTAAARMISAARARLEQAKAEYANAVGVLVAAKKKAVDAVMEKTTAEAAKQIPVPDNATGEERIKAKAEQDRLAQKLAKADLDKIAEMYGDVPGVDPTRR